MKPHVEIVKTKSAQSKVKQTPIDDFNQAITVNI